MRVIFTQLPSENIASINSGEISNFVKVFYGKLIDFFLDFFENCPTRSNEDYQARAGEIKSDWVPNFPLLRELQKYEADKRNSNLDSEALEFLK